LNEPLAPHAAARPESPTLRLSVMMFLQYAIWGAWLPLFYPFLLNNRHMEVLQVGNLIAIGAIGALFAPFIAGQIADRWFNTEHFLAISHLAGAVLVWLMASADTYGELAVLSLLYGLIYAPTLSLTNSLAFHHLADRDRDFGKVRVWGTVGWIVVGIGMAQWLLYRHTPEGLQREAVMAAQYAGMADSLRLSGVLGVLMGLFCLMLPSTPPQRGRQKFAPLEAVGYVFRNPMRNPLFWLFVISFPMSCVHQFYFVHTSEFLNRLNLGSEAVNRVFGVGGGGLMTIGQMAEILVLGLMPLVAKKVPRKTLLAVGLCAYILRFTVFAYVQQPWAVIPALALHGLCFGCFLFVAFMIVDEENSADVRASAQGLYNLVVVGVGIIVGSWFAGYIGQIAKPSAEAAMDYRLLFSVPLWITVACLIALLLFYPRRSAAPLNDGSAMQSE
jgi:nucleoside transporter